MQIRVKHALALFAVAVVLFLRALRPEHRVGKSRRGLLCYPSSQPPGLPRAGDRRVRETARPVQGPLQPQQRAADDRGCLAARLRRGSRNKVDDRLFREIVRRSVDGSWIELAISEGSERLGGPRPFTRSARRVHRDRPHLRDHPQRGGLVVPPVPPRSRQARRWPRGPPSSPVKRST